MNLFYCIFPFALNVLCQFACHSLHMHFFQSNDRLAQQTFEFAHCVQYRHVNLLSLWGLGTLQIPSSLLLPFLPHFSQWKGKVYDTSNTHPQPWPSSTLPQSSATLLIIRLSQLCLLVRLSNWCPLPNLAGNYIRIRGASSLNPPLFSALPFYGPLLLARTFGSTLPVILSRIFVSFIIVWKRWHFMALEGRPRVRSCDP